MAYTAAQNRIAIYRGMQIGAELITILPSARRMGGEPSADIDADYAFVQVMSPNMEFRYNVVTFLDGALGTNPTKQIALHREYLKEIGRLVSSGLRFNDLVWIDDISKKTTVAAITGGSVTGESLNQSVSLTNIGALGSLTPGASYLYFGSLSANQGFFAKVDGVSGSDVTVDIPGEILLGGVVEEDARKIENGYDVYAVSIGYHRCLYTGQTMPEVQEGSMDTERFNATYEFLSDREANFEGE